MSGYKTIKVNSVDSKHMATVIVHVHILTPMWFTVKINWIYVKSIHRDIQHSIRTSLEFPYKFTHNYRYKT